jgi:hypothetical protein
MLEPLLRTVFTVQCKVPRVGDSWVYAVGAWGNLCQANLPSDGKPPLTAKSLSANSVYHAFAYSLARGLFHRDTGCGAAPYKLY